jgi:hypothetical protein
MNSSQKRKKLTNKNNNNYSGGLKIYATGNWVVCVLL